MIYIETGMWEFIPSELQNRCPASGVVVTALGVRARFLHWIHLWFWRRSLAQLDSSSNNCADNAYFAGTMFFISTRHARTPNTNPDERLSDGCIGTIRDVAKRVHLLNGTAFVVGALITLLLNRDGLVLAALYSGATSGVLWYLASALMLGNSLSKTSQGGTVPEQAALNSCAAFATGWSAMSSALSSLYDKGVYVGWLGESFGALRIYPLTSRAKR